VSAKQLYIGLYLTLTKLSHVKDTDSKIEFLLCLAIAYFVQTSFNSRQFHKTYLVFIMSTVHRPTVIYVAFSID